MSRSSGSNSYNTTLRLLRLMQEIPRRSAGSRAKIGTRALAGQLARHGFSVSLRTVQRDLLELQKHFPGLENDGNRDQQGWYWREDSPLHDVPAMTPPMAFAFRIAERVLRPAMPEPLRALAPYLDTARRLLAGKSRHWVEQVHVIPRSLPLLPAKVSAEVLSGVYDALARRCRMRVQYRPREGTPAEYELSPLGLVLRHEVSYLVATAWDYDDVRHYALHRFVPNTVTLVERSIHRPADFDLDRYVRAGEFQYLRGKRPLKLRLRMDEAVARHLEETPLSEDQEIQSLESGWVRIRATVADSQQLRWWLLGLGEHVVVEGPKSLRQDVSRSLRAAAEAYLDDPVSPKP